VRSSSDPNTVQLAIASMKVGMFVGMSKGDEWHVAPANFVRQDSTGSSMLQGQSSAVATARVADPVAADVTQCMQQAAELSAVQSVHRAQLPLLQSLSSCFISAALDLT
jgi:hypothetical protein